MLESDKVLLFTHKTFSQTQTKAPASSSGWVQGIYTSEITIDKEDKNTHHQPLERCDSAPSQFFTKKNVQIKQHLPYHQRVYILYYVVMYRNIL